MRPLSTLLLASLALLGCGTRSRDAGSVAVRRIILAQVARYPRMQPEDLYKLLHQAAMGSEHAMTDTAGVRAWMTAELAAMGEGPADPSVDTIAPDGSVVRVYLRPWVRAGRSTDSLTLAFIATAGAIVPDTARLVRYLAVAETLVVEEKLPFQPGPWREFVAERRRERWPAVQHSRPYEDAYRPAYRVVAKTLVP